MGTGDYTRPVYLTDKDISLFATDSFASDVFAEKVFWIKRQRILHKAYDNNDSDVAGESTITGEEPVEEKHFAFKGLTSCEIQEAFRENGFTATFYDSRTKDPALRELAALIGEKYSLFRKVTLNVKRYQTNGYESFNVAIRTVEDCKALAKMTELIRGDNGRVSDKQDISLKDMIGSDSSVLNFIYSEWVKEYCASGLDEIMREFTVKEPSLRYEVLLNVRLVGESAPEKILNGLDCVLVLKLNNAVPRLLVIKTFPSVPAEIFMKNYKASLGLPNDEIVVFSPEFDYNGNIKYAEHLKQFFKISGIAGFKEKLSAVIGNIINEISDEIAEAEDDYHVSVPDIRELKSHFSKKCNFEIKSYGTVNDTHYFSKATDYITHHYDILKAFMNEVHEAVNNNKLQIKHKFKNKREADCITKLSERLASCSIFMNYSSDGQGIVVNINRTNPALKYLGGGYLEDYVCYTADKILSEIAAEHDVEYVAVKNVELIRPADKKKTVFELDGVIMLRMADTGKFHIFCIEAKSGKCFNNFKSFSQKLKRLKMVPDNCMIIGPQLAEQAASYDFRASLDMKSIEADLREMIGAAIERGNIAAAAEKAEALKKAEEIASFHRVKQLVESTKIVNLSDNKLKAFAFFNKRQQLLNEGEEEAAKNFFKLHPELHEMFIVDYIKNTQCEDYGNNISSLTESEAKQYEIGILKRIAVTYNAYAEECYKQISRLENKPIDERFRSLYIDDKLNLKPMNYLERKKEAFKDKHKR